MKKLGLLVMPLMVISLLASCGNGNKSSTYTVTWKNDDGTILEIDENVPFGTIPTYDHEEPKKEATQQFIYTFKGWDGDITQKIVADTTFMAQYSETLQTYTITFVDEDGTTVLDKMENAPYGTKIEYKGEDPTKDPTVQYEYSFAGWEPELKEGTVVTDNQTYKATYTPSLRKYEIKFVNYNGINLDKKELTFGETPIYEGAIPTRPMEGTTYYSFNGWDPQIHTVYSKETYKATYRSIETADIAAYMRINIPHDGATFSFECNSTTDISVNWGDGKIDASKSHVYDASGEYDILLYGGVTSISVRNNSYLNEIYLSDSITLIDKDAFQSCSNLVSIRISEKVTAIGERAFNGCKSLTTVTIPEKVESIDEDAFRLCRALLSVKLPSSLKHIRNGAFKGCLSLKNATLNKGLIDIDSEAFENCLSLTSIIIPSTVTSIGHQAFKGCFNLSNIKVADGNEYYDSRNNCNAIIAKEMYGNGTLIIGSSRTIIPSTVTSIDTYAFEMVNLTSIVIPSSVTSIGDCAFKNCLYLENVTLNKGLYSIGDVAFENCLSLTSIIIPSTVTSIGHQAFTGCVYLSNIEVTEGNEYYDSRNDCNAIITKKEIESQGIPADTLILGSSKTTIPSTVTSIGDYAFGYNINLTSIVIPTSVTSIGTGAFIDCLYLENVTLNEGLYSIGDVAFENCLSLTSIIIPSSVTSISNYAFTGCVYLSNIEVTEGNEYYDSRNDCNAIITKKEIESQGIPANTLILGSYKTVIPDTVTSIGDYAFDSNINLTSIVIPGSVTSIGTGAFIDCFFLEVVDLTKATTPPSLGDVVFASCLDVKFYVDKTMLTTFKENSDWSGYAERITDEPVPSFIQK